LCYFLLELDVHLFCMYNVFISPSMVGLNELLHSGHLAEKRLPLYSLAGELFLHIGHSYGS